MTRRDRTEHIHAPDIQVATERKVLMKRVDTRMIEIPVRCQQSVVTSWREVGPVSFFALAR
jgi:hypothetical protein